MPRSLGNERYVNQQRVHAAPQSPHLPLAARHRFLSRCGSVDEARRRPARATARAIHEFKIGTAGRWGLLRAELGGSEHLHDRRAAPAPSYVSQGIDGSRSGICAPFPTRRA